MSADEIKALAQQAFVYGMASHRAGLLDMEVRCKQFFAALLAYAAMVERCEEARLDFHSCPDERDIINYILRGDAGKDNENK